jgi:tetratricopeptide (TPR) repeat protein
MKPHVALLALVSFASAAAFAADDAPPPPRPVARKPVEPPKFENGKLTDTYWGVTYALPGLEQKKGDRQFGKLFDGKVGRVQIEVGVFEYADRLSAKERRDADKKKWDDKHRVMTDYAQGDDPAPWATFVGEAPSGDKRRDGYAWFARGPRAFVVHAFAALDAEGGAEGVKAALGGLTVGEETGAAVLAQVAARGRGLPWDDPGAMNDGAQQYMQDESASGVAPRPLIAEDLVRRAIALLPGSRLDDKPAAALALHVTLSHAQMKLSKFDDALATLTKCVELATKTDTAGPSGAAVQYDFACCYSLMGRLDEAFAALDKAWARAADWGPPVTDEELKNDKDLENCRKDPRWAKFLAGKPTKK